MNVVLETVKNFFDSIAGIIEAFFGFLKGLIPTTEAPQDPETTTE